MQNIAACWGTCNIHSLLGRLALQVSFHTARAERQSDGTATGYKSGDAVTDTHGAVYV